MFVIYIEQVTPAEIHIELDILQLKNYLALW